MGSAVKPADIIVTARERITKACCQRYVTSPVSATKDLMCA